MNELNLLYLKVTPNASKDEITGWKNERLYVRIAAPPADNKANACLCAFLAKISGCAKKDIIIIKGEKSRLKTISAPAAYIQKLLDIAAGKIKK